MIKRKEIIISILLLTAFLLYFPLTFLGYGSDNDSYRVVNTSQKLISYYKYEPSRYPGYFVHELFSAFLINFGGSFLSNLGTLFLSLISIFSFYKIAEYYNLKNIFILSLILIIHPIYWVNSTCTIDYIWALGFLLSGYLLLLKNRTFFSILLLSLSVGCRLSSALVILSIFFVRIMIQRNNIKKEVVILFFTGIISSLFYLPPFIYAGYSLKFLTYQIGNWSLIEYFVRFIYKNIYFFGFLSTFFILFLVLRYFKKFNEAVKENKFLVFTIILIIFSIELLFLKIPLENEYLLPALPFFILLLGIIFQDNKKILIVFLLLTFSYNFINFNFLKTDLENNAKSGKIGLFVEKGYLINDIYKRLEYKNKSSIQ
ncbi:MAG: hypothetical protein JXB50_15710 [Spirochaetes bacterium]|nr:hypothetical protein [Spirochaetota bacterium]